MTDDVLKTPITQLSGVGPKRADAFAKLGIFTFGDLVTHYPRAYEDRSATKKIIELSHDETVCIKAVVAGALQTNYKRKNLKIYTLRVSDGTGFIELVWFNNRFLEKRFKQGDAYIFYGKVRLTPKKQMLTPLFEAPGHQKQTGCIMPLYPLTEGLTNAVLADCIAQVLARFTTLQDTLPAALRSEFALCELNFAIHNIHFPKNQADCAIARRRLAFEELFMFQTALFSLKAANKRHAAPQLSADVHTFLAALPFSLTDAQNRVIREIIGDLSSGLAMNRLVCGDVGSGKTIVAAAALYSAVQNGFQAAFMAPTEILAQQHHKSLSALFQPYGIRVELLSGSLPAKLKREALERLACGTAQIAVGTHALLSETVHFHNLALTVTDEQHRFGVNQRKLLTEKGENPHMLVMSATPIPRTLAFILYGDLDVSMIDELPPGRQTIDTFAVGESYRKRVYAFLQKQIDAGRQAYIVCPLVEESDALSLHAAAQYAETLQKKVFPNVPVGLLHGKMKPSEKDAVMSAFKNGDLKILVATSVIEVGIDVPNATVMMIENAERFGLSQLHQLRGRVGRGSHKSYCILMSGTQNDTALHRLQVMRRESNGFKIAEADLAQRGPGEFFGTRQHGLPVFKIACLYSDMELLQQTTLAARRYIDGQILCTDEEKTKIEQKIEALFNNRVTFA